jgi:T5SS/PEP-CTERM-associated repeat protein/autotransporter-associated beta strand protein
MRCRVVTAAVFALAAPASAQTFDWNNPNGGSFATPGNWTPAGPPGANAVARFNVPSTFTVTFPGSVTNGLLTFSQGNMTWSMGGNSYNTTSLGNTIGVGASLTTLKVQSGTVTTAGLTVGGDSGSNCFLTVDISSTWSTGSSSFAVGGPGGTGTVLLQNGGQLTTGQAYIGSGANGTGSLTVAGPSSKWTLSDFMRIGDAGNGTVTVNGSGQVIAQSVILAAQTNSSGVLTVTGPSSTLTASGSLLVGLSGPASLNVFGGGSVTASTTFTLGEFVGSSGAVTVSGAGSTLTVNGGATIGGLNNTQPVGAQMVIGSGGTVSLNGATTLQSTAIININGGTLNLGTITEQPGTALNWSTGTVRFANGSSYTPAIINQLLAGTNTVAAGQTLAATAGTLNLTTPLIVSGNGAIGGSAISTTASLTINTLGTVTASDTVTLGSGTVTQVNDLATLAATNGVTNNGLLQLNGPAAAVNGFVANNFGTIQGNGRLNNGLSNGTGGTMRLRTGDYIVVDGIGPTNLGNIELDGGTIEFTKTLSNLGNGFISGRGEFRGSTSNLGGTGLTNSGVMAFSGGNTDIRGDVLNNSTGHIVMAGGGVLTFYDDVTHNGVEIRTNAGSRTVFFGAQSGAGPFTGTGTVEYNGDLRPGNSPARVTYEGDVLLNSSATLHSELGGTIPGSQYDQLSVQGSITIGGGLQLSFINGFVPAPGDSFILIQDRGPNPINGIFTGLPEGGYLNYSGETFQATYLGGTTGHDFVITVVPEPGTLALCGVAALGCMAFRRRKAAALGLLLAAGIPAQAQTWNGPGTDWNTAANWLPATVPNSNSAAVSLTAAGPNTVNISSSVQAQSITFSNAMGGYVLTSSAGQTLGSISAITVSPAITGVQTINLANVATGSLLFATGGPLTITNNSAAAGTTLVIGPNTVIGTPGGGGVVITGFGNTQFTGSFASNASPYNQVLGGLTKTGSGTFTMSGNGANLNGSITLNDGTLILDYSANAASKLNTGAVSGLYLNGGVLSITPSAGNPLTQNLPGGTAVGVGHTDILATGTGTFTLAAGAITHTVGGTADFSPATGNLNFGITTSTGNMNGLLGTGQAFATVNGGATWAWNSGGTIAGVTTYGPNTYSTGTNTDVTTSAAFAGIMTNSLRFSGYGVTLTLSGTNTLQSGGILVPLGFATITGGTLSVPGAGELFAHAYGELHLNSAIVAPGGLTKSGTGDLYLGGTNSGLTGPININRGNLWVTNTAAVNSASQINFNDGRSVAGLAYTSVQSLLVDLGNNANGAITAPIRLSGGSPSGYATMFNPGYSTGSTITLSGAITSTAGLNTPIRFIGSYSVPSDNSTSFNLTGVNTFTGNIDLYQGALGINSDASLGNVANTLSLELNNTTVGGLVFLNGGINVAHPIVVNYPTRFISNGTDSNTISGPVSGPGGIYKTGTGTLALTSSNNNVTGQVAVAAGTLTYGTNGYIGFVDVTVAAGATFSPATNAFANGFKSLTLNGGTFRVPSGAGMQVDTTSITVGAAGGTVDYTGAGNDEIYLSGNTGGITINGNSNWASPGNSTYIANSNFSGSLPIAIAPGATFTNGLALCQFFPGAGFSVVGGGTLFQNADATNVLNMSAPLTVVQSRFRVMDASSNGGVGNLGTGLFTLDGGTLSYAGGMAPPTTKAISLTANGGTITVETPGVTLTANGAITGLGGLTVVGPGTLVLGSAGNSFSSLTINSGTVQAASDGVLGSGPVTVGAAGTLIYTATTMTTRTITLNFGTLSVSTGATLNLSGAAVFGGYLVGPGAYTVAGGTSLTAVTTYASTAITQNGTGSFTNFTNGGPLTITGGVTGASLTRFTNQGSGSILIGPAAQVNAADFQSDGMLTIASSPGNQPTQLTNVGATPMYFNGGSRTFISTPQQAANLNAGIDLHGNDAVVAGGLFVNNGYVIDSSNNGNGTHRVIADYGSVVKGAGFWQTLPKTVNGGTFIAGNSPGHATTGAIVLGGPNDSNGGLSDYTWQINNAGPSTSYPSATGTSGPSANAARQVSGWGTLLAVAGTSLMATSGNFQWDAMPSDKLTIHLQTLLAPNDASGSPSAAGGYGSAGDMTPGLMTDFDPALGYSWRLFGYVGNYTGPTDTVTLDASTNLDTSGFLNPHAGRFDLVLNQSAQEMDLVFTPTAVPEPGVLPLCSLAAIGWVTYWRKRWRTAAALLGGLIVVGPASATDRTWSITATSPGNWSTSANWSGGVPVSGDTIYFVNSTYNAANQNIQSNYQIDYLFFDQSLTTFTLSGSSFNGTGGQITTSTTGNVTINNAIGLASGQFNFLIINGAAGTLNLNGPITGPNYLDIGDNLGFQSSPVTVVLGSSANTFQGATLLYGATLRLGVNSAMPAGSYVSVATGCKFDIGTTSSTAGSAMGSVSVADGGTMSVGSGANGNFYLGSLSFTGGLLTDGGLSNGVTFHLTGNGLTAAATANGPAIIALANNGKFVNDSNGPMNIDVEFDNAGLGLDVTARLSGAGNNPTFVKTNSGTLRLLNSTNTANLTMHGGRLRFDSVSTFSTGTMTFDGGQLGYYGVTASSPKAFSVTALGGTLEVGGPQYTLTLNGVISGNGPITAIGPGTLAFGAAMGYTGSTTVSGGKLQAAVANALPSTTALTVNGTGTFDLNGQTMTIASLTIGNANGVTLNGGALSTGSATLGGPLAGPGALGLTGPATVTVAGALNGPVDVSLSAAGLLTTGAFAVGIGSLAGPAGTVTISAGGSLTTGLDSSSTSFGGVIQGPGPFTKNGTGTLTLSGINTFAGGLTVNGGVLAITSDAALGAAGPAVNVGAGGKLLVMSSTATSRTFSLGGTIEVASGATLQYQNGAAVNGGYLRGAGTHAVNGATFTGASTYNTTTVSVTGPGSFINFSNGGTINITAPAASPTVFDGFINQGSGTIAAGGGSNLNVNDFQSYGTINLTPATDVRQFTLLTNTGSAPMNFNGGSRTFVGTINGNGLAGVDVHGNDAIVAGGLFVNNGSVYDSVGAGNHRVVADYGSLVKGAGFYQPLPKTINGGTFVAGNSPGHATTGTIILGGPNDRNGGLSDFTWQINDAGPSASHPSATGTSGPTANASKQVSGWGTLLAVAGISPLATNGNMQWDATPSDKLTIHLATLLAPNDPSGNVSASGGYGSAGDMTPGLMTDFDPSQSYSWRLFGYQGGYTGPTDTASLDASTDLDASGFLNPHAGRFDLTLNQAAQEMDLVYTPTAVPEPGTLLLSAAAGIGCVGAARRRRHPSAAAGLDPL